MKLRKWRCGTCGFEWFEPIEAGRSAHNINHGCPQGCDDAGKPCDTLEASDTNKEWICWILSKKEIDSTANRVGLNPKKLKENDYKNIVKKFTEELKKANRQWELILDNAVETVVRLQIGTRALISIPWSSSFASKPSICSLNMIRKESRYVQNGKVKVI